MMFVRVVVVALAVVFAAGCESGVDTSELSGEEQKHLESLAGENVASFGAPPLIPVDHEFVIGEDIYHFENGGDACLDCHGDESEKDVPQTTHPERHNCLQCHVPQTVDTWAEGDFKVDNTFNRYDPDAAGR